MTRSVPVRNAWHMLLYAWDQGAWAGHWDASAEKSPELLGLLAFVLLDVTRPLLRRELGKQFAERRATVAGVRGRIDFARSLKQMSFEAGRAHCAFPELDIDTHANRILRGTFVRLAMDSRVAGETKKKTSALRHELREAAALMGGVTVTRVDAGMFRLLPRTRRSRAYALALAICQLVCRLEMPGEDSQGSALLRLLDDRIRFPSLFEAFIRNFWRHHLTGHTVQAEHLHWFDSLDEPLAPGMRTDVVITQRTDPRRRLVVDAKFYKNALSAGQFGAEKLRAAHVYQMYAYLRTQEDRGPRFRDAEGMLVYASTGGFEEAVMRVQGHTIRFAAVDLTAPWQEIEARLLALVSVGVAPPSVWRTGDRVGQGSAT